MEILFQFHYNYYDAIQQKQKQKHQKAIPQQVNLQSEQAISVGRTGSVFDSAKQGLSLPSLASGPESLC